ncbi:MAG: hypothetical protein LC118_05870 [Dehalococcoidia bacterium]|nr:hypothetical protein [Dehalococcoidia bacterium]
MALTTAQLNAHIRTMIQEELVREGAGTDAEAVRFLLRACAHHARTGTPDDLEAAKTVAQFIFETVIGRSATEAGLHLLRNHIGPDVGAAGGVF